MSKKTDWQIPLDAMDPSVLLSTSAARLMSQPSVRADWESALLESKSLVHPAAVWEHVRVSQFLHDRLIMENGTVLTGGPIAQVMAGAEQLIVGVCTVGSEVSLAAADARQQGATMRSIFLDAFGTYTVGMIREQMVAMFEKEMKSQGLHISTMLSPGESTWPISQQAALFTLVDASQIGVSLTGTLMMDPMKSTSMVMGYGSQSLGSEGATNCDFCTIKDTCPGSKVRESQAV